MSGYTEGKHDDPADTQDRLVKIGSKYQATAPSVADGDNVYILVDAAGRVVVTGDIAHNAVDSGNPHKIGGTAVDTAAGHASVAAGDRIHAAFDRQGRLQVNIADFNGNTAAKINGDSQLTVTPRTNGASDVKSVRGTIGSTTRATLLTPTSGKKVRIISLEVTGQDAAAHNIETYFATGANITTNAGKEIAEPLVDLTDAPNYHEPSPDGGGPVGAVDDVVSMRCSTAPTTASIVHVKYREE